MKTKLDQIEEDDNATKMKETMSEMNNRIIELTITGDKRNFEIDGRLKNLQQLIQMKQASAAKASVASAIAAKVTRPKKERSPEPVTPKPEEEAETPKPKL